MLAGRRLSMSVSEMSVTIAIEADGSSCDEEILLMTTRFSFTNTSRGESVGTNFPGLTLSRSVFGCLNWAHREINRRRGFTNPSERRSCLDGTLFG